MQRPLSRRPVNKRRSAKTFNKKTRLTKAANARVMRGGIRF